ncbi:MAG TPA: NAD(P)-dependent alcohol dehydrogenase [Alcanivoracaceae bacterium]|nr:NAD(P)-dependent alcohol dehydrogenase [Alcanivoracaceae bacterium]
MKAVVVAAPGGLDKVSLIDIADPGKPKAGEIRVAIKAGSLNFHDLLVANGGIPTEDNRILLSDGAGVVEEVGEGVTEFKPGDHVVSTFFPVWPAGPAFADVGHFRNVPGDGLQGMASEYVVRSVNAFTHAPQGWSHAQAATITTSGLTAWRALVVNGQLKAGDTVLVQGTGGVSITALQIAKAMGAIVVVTSSSDEKLDAAKKLGADYTINYNTEPKWGRKAAELTGGVDHVIEVGGPATIGQSLNALKVGGHIAQIGILSGTTAELPVMQLLAKQARLQGLIVANRQDQQNFVKALEVIDAQPVIDTTYEYAELAEAFAYQQSGQHFGKICVQW